MLAMCPDSRSAQVGSGESVASNVAVYAWSAGNGVSNQALAKVVEVERHLVNHPSPNTTARRFKKSRVGLEGEVLLCIETNSLDARDSLVLELQKVVGTIAGLTVTPSRCSVR